MGLSSWRFLKNHSPVSHPFCAFGENSMVRKGNTDSNMGRIQRIRGIKEAENSLVKWIPIPYGHYSCILKLLGYIDKGKSWTWNPSAQWNDLEQKICWWQWRGDGRGRLSQIEWAWKGKRFAYMCCLLVCLFSSAWTSIVLESQKKTSKIQANTPVSPPCCGKIIFWDNAIFLTLSWSLG